MASNRQSNRAGWTLFGLTAIVIMFVAIWQQSRPTTIYGIRVAIDGDHFEASLATIDDRIVARCTSRIGGSSQIVLPGFSQIDWDQPDIQISAREIEYRLAGTVVAVYNIAQRTLSPKPYR